MGENKHTGVSERERKERGCKQREKVVMRVYMEYEKLK